MKITSTTPVNFNRKTHNNKLAFGLVWHGDIILNVQAQKKLLDEILEQADNFRFLGYPLRTKNFIEFQIAGKATCIDLIENGNLVNNVLVIRRPLENEYTVTEDIMPQETFKVFNKIQEKLTNLIPKNKD